MSIGKKWNLKLKNNIEQYRKGDVVIKFNSDTPLSDDTVIEVEQISHEFRFGANLFMLDEFETEEKNKEFRQKFPEIFNLATLPFYWNSIEPEKGKFRYEKDFNKWSFLTADKYFHNNSLMINDHLDFGCMRSLHGEFFGHRSPYYAHIEQLLNEGVHLDSIGFQYHCFFTPEKEAELAVSRYNPQHIYKVLDTYATLGKKIQITEMTVSAFANDNENEEVQAELIKNLYSVFFSHPAMEAIIYWNIYDGYASGDIGNMNAGENIYRGGLCDYDMREKPAYKVLKKLISF